MRLAYAYTVYSVSLRDFVQGGMHEMLEKRSREARDSVEYFTRRAAVLGGAVHAPDIEPPPPATGPFEILRTLIRLEQEAMFSMQQLRPKLGENPMKFAVEQQLTEQQYWMDHMWGMLPVSADAPMGAQVDALMNQPSFTSELPPGMVDPAAPAATPVEPPAEEVAKVASRLFRLLKRAEGEEAALPPNDLAAPGALQSAPTVPGDVQAWLQQEGILRQQENAASSEFYVQKYREAMERLQQLQQQASANDQQMQQLQQQTAAAQQQISQAQQQSQLVEDAAMRNLQVASQRTVNALQQNQQLQDQLLSQQQLAIQERGNHQALRGQLMQLAQGAPDPQAFAPPQVALDPSGQPGVPAMDGAAPPTGPAAQGPAAPSDPTAAAPGPQGPQTPAAQAGGEANPPQGGQPGAETKVSADISSILSSPWVPRVAGAVLGAGAGKVMGDRHGDHLVQSLPQLRQEAEAFEAKRNAGTMTMREALSAIRNATEIATAEIEHKNPGIVGRMSILPSAMAGARALPAAINIGKHLRTLGS
jgi:hypothetical protein